MDIFTFGYHPLREIYIRLTDALSEPSEAIPLANYLTPDALPMPPLHFTLVFEPETDAERLVETLVSNWQAPVYLVFSPAHIPPFEPPPQHTNTLIENILGRPWDGEKNPGWIPLPDAQMRRRAVRALGIKGFHRLYLVAGSPATTALPPYVNQLFKKWNGLTKIDEPEVDYRLFHALVSNCDWLLTSHGNVPGTVPFCFYSVQSFRAVMQVAKNLPHACRIQRYRRPEPSRRHQCKTEGWAGSLGNCAARDASWRDWTVPILERAGSTR